MKNLKRYALALDVYTETMAGVLREALGDRNVLCVGGDCLVCYVTADSFREAKVRLFDAWCANTTQHFPMGFSQIRAFGRMS